MTSVWNPSDLGVGVEAPSPTYTEPMAWSGPILALIGVWIILSYKK